MNNNSERAKRWHRKNIAERNPHYRFVQAKCYARRAKIPVLLTEKEYVLLVSAPCYYCNKELPPSGIGLDRINNDKSIGYTINNVLPCCGECNGIRSNRLTVDETKVVVRALIEYRKSLYDISRLGESQEEISNGQKTKVPGGVR